MAAQPTTDRTVRRESRNEATQVQVSDSDVEELRFQLSWRVCSTTISGQLLDAEGNGIPNTWVSAGGDGARVSAQTAADGTFTITMPSAGSYILSMDIDGCTAYYRPDGATGIRDEATQVQVSDSDVAGIRLQLTEGMCKLRISGKLVNADGSPGSGVWVGGLGTSGRGGAWTGADGSFSFAVPAGGSYRLYAWIDGCSVYRSGSEVTTNWQSASQINVANADVNGIEFSLPENPGNLCS